ncbi:hypothetical protein DOTSEDRAFT_80052 [Dothistroma septosporum NZE10]|uniref:Uncharacterized protein n=1 Tax=Dothistroma septosporum (strain NZE10 / CBS 128990) TaxID=675120 RepID=N1PPC7_DOTSN|nr:hypothetical protein DOTSEDRAFT_80052 [Dothistroma septosporum NZE10]
MVPSVYIDRLHTTKATTSPGLRPSLIERAVVTTHLFCSTRAGHSSSSTTGWHFVTSYIISRPSLHHYRQASLPSLPRALSASRHCMPSMNLLVLLQTMSSWKDAVVHGLGLNVCLIDPAGSIVPEQEHLTHALERTYILQVSRMVASRLISKAMYEKVDCRALPKSRSPALGPKEALLSHLVLPVIKTKDATPCPAGYCIRGPLRGVAHEPRSLVCSLVEKLLGDGLAD